MPKSEPVFVPRPLKLAQWDMEGIGAQLSFLQGEVLTITEAAITGPQLEAVKGLIKGAFRGRINYMRSLVGLDGPSEGRPCN